MKYLNLDYEAMQECCPISALFMFQETAFHAPAEAVCFQPRATINNIRRIEISEGLSDFSDAPAPYADPID